MTAAALLFIAVVTCQGTAPLFYVLRMFFFLKDIFLHPYRNVQKYDFTLGMEVNILLLTDELAELLPH